MSSRKVPAYYGVRTLDHKLIYYRGLDLDQTKYSATLPELEFFDLRTNPAENHNLYNDLNYFNQIKELVNQLIKLKMQYDDTDDAYPELIETNKQYSYNN